MCGYFFFSSRRRHTRLRRDWSSDVCSSDLEDNTIDRILLRSASHPGATCPNDTSGNRAVSDAWATKAPKPAVSPDHHSAALPVTCHVGLDAGRNRSTRQLESASNGPYYRTACREYPLWPIDPDVVWRFRRRNTRDRKTPNRP